MINKTDEINIGTLFFGTDFGFIIPPYQRAYAWSQNQWRQLFDDLVENDAQYFLGSTIVVQKERDLEAGTVPCLVIDGQQRLTTISILLAALSSRLDRFEADFQGDEEDLLKARMFLRNALVVKKPVPTPRLCLQIQNDNRDDYAFLLHEAINERIPAKNIPYGSNRRIRRAFGFFCDRIDELVQGAADKCRCLLDFLENKVKTAVIVQISVSRTSDAYVLFEALNNRGMPLSAIDLMKNILLSSLSGRNDAELDLYFNDWNTFLKTLDDDPSTQDRFLRYAYAAFRREMNAPFLTGEASFPLGAVATRSNLLEIYERCIRKNPQGMLEWFLTMSRLYASILHPADTTQPLGKALVDLSHVQGAGSHVLLLGLFRNREALGLTEARMARIVALLVRFFVRRNLTDTPSTHDLVRLFISLGEAIEDRALKGDDIPAFIRQKLVEVSPSDETFAASLRGDVYAENPEVTRFILSALAEPSVTKEMKPLWAREGRQNRFVWTIEHVLPQGDSLPDDWTRMIADGDRLAARALQDRWCHKLGNLTLTGFNSELSNRPFLEKRDHRNGAGTFTGYRNGLNLNEELVRKTSWTCADIEERTNRMAAAALRLFSLAAWPESEHDGGSRS